MGKKAEVSEHNFTEGKALHYYLCSVMQSAKLSFMIKNELNFLNLVLKRLWKMIF